MINRRYFLSLAYNGSNYHGWQKQPKHISIQQTLEEAFSTILGQKIEITGCGRTDSGVHAKQYFAHFNYSGEFPEAFLRRINKYLPKDIAIYQLFQTHWDAHARFDAYHRSYEYHLRFNKDPFHLQTSYQYTYPLWPDLEKMQQAARLISHYDAFFPFCKTNHDSKTLICDIRRSEWIYYEDEARLVYHVSANRFLRGMVRLLVGMCINVGLDKIPLAEVKKALDQQTQLRMSTSAPAQGLFLTDIRYPFMENGVYQGSLEEEEE